MPEINKKLPLRLTVRVVVRRGKKVCIILNKKNGQVVNVNVPGGGVEEGSTLEETAVVECLEEVGILVHNVRPLNLRLAKHHEMKKTERNDVWSGTDTHYMIADYVRMDNSKLGADGDAVDFVWLDIPAAIEFVKQAPPNPFNETKIEALMLAGQIISPGVNHPKFTQW